MYAARRRQRSVQWKFQFGELCIGQQLQLFDNPLRQFPQGCFIGHQVALHAIFFAVRWVFTNYLLLECTADIRRRAIV